MRPLKLCFVSLHAFPVFRPTAPGIFGGTETRAATIAQGMQKLTNCEVSFLARNARLREPQTVEGIHFIPWRDFWTGVRAHVAEHLDILAPGSMIRVKKWSSHLLWEIPALAVLYPTRKRQRNPQRCQRVFDEIDTDAFLAFGVGSTSAAVIANAKRLGKPCLVFTGADSDVDFSDQADPQARRVYGEADEVCRWVLENADHLIVQNEFQQTCITEQIGRDCTLLRNPIDPASWQQLSACSDQPELPFSDYILWIGRVETYHKRAPLAVDIARQFPEERFVLVLNPRDAELERKLTAEMPANVHVIRQLPFSQMPGLFSKAKLYFNTSSRQYEGFPNAFLQATVCGTPISSLEVGTEFLNSSGAGLCADGNLEQQVQDIRTLLADPDPNARMARALEYVNQHYSLQAIVHQLEALLREKLGQ